MKKVAIIYICTGPYITYWKNFFDSFEDKFLPKWEKHYFVFTDQKNIYQNENPRVHWKYQMSLPWPIITLLKFQIVLDNEEELRDFDFVYMSNANIICENVVTEKEFLPRKELGEQISFTQHAAPYIDKSKAHCYNFDYERNTHSSAYIPYNIGKTYVYGNMHGGYTEEYINFMKECKYAINEDLKRGIIARWHDESHVNHYVVTHNNYRILDTGYCYPVGFDVPFERKIIGVSKATVFDVNTFKGYYNEPQLGSLKRYTIKLQHLLHLKVLPKIYYLRDQLLRKKAMGQVQ